MAEQMQRRAFITLLGGAAAMPSILWPLAARTQQPTMPVIGFLHQGSSGPNAPQVASFLLGLRETGYIDGQNVTIRFMWAEGRYDQLPAMAGDLVGRGVSVIAVALLPAALAAK